MSQNLELVSTGLGFPDIEPKRQRVVGFSPQQQEGGLERVTPCSQQLNELHITSEDGDWSHSAPCVAVVASAREQQAQQPHLIGDCKEEVYQLDGRHHEDLLECYHAMFPTGEQCAVKDTVVSSRHLSAAALSDEVKDSFVSSKHFSAIHRDEGQKTTTSTKNKQSLSIRLLEFADILASACRYRSMRVVSKLDYADSFMGGSACIVSSVDFDRDEYRTNNHALKL
jgi:hypothetical protein